MTQYLFRGHSFMTSTKNDPVVNPKTRAISKNEQQIYFLKTIESTNMRQFLRGWTPQVEYFETGSYRYYLQ